MAKKRAPIEEVRDWEVIQQNDTDKTERLMVIGGWLYRVVGAVGMALVFVPGKKR